MPSIAELLEQHREHILQCYLAEAGQLLSARRVHARYVGNGLPEYLTALGALSRGKVDEASLALRRLEESHLELRLRAGYTLEDMTAEYALLGQVLSGLWASLPQEQRPAPEELQRLTEALRAAREHAIAAFSRGAREAPEAPDPRLDSQALYLGEERLRLAVEATGLGTWDFDPVSGTLHWDARSRALFGLTAEDEVLDYGRFLGALHPEDRERVDAVVQRALEPSSGGAFQMEYRILRPPDGAERWLSANGQTFFDASGRAVRFIGTVLDITEQVRAREAAARAEHRATVILESISEAFFAFDREWRLIYVNREAERLVGQPREELLGRDHWVLYPATLGTAVELNYRRAAAERIPLSFENHYAPWDRWFEIRVYPTDEGVAAYFQDITERKRRDEERERFLLEQTQLREQAEQALRERQRAVEVLEHGEAVVVLDRDFRILLVNEHQERLSRTRREETLGRSIWDVFPTIATPDSVIWREFHRVMEERVPARFEEYYAPLDFWVGMSAFPTAEGGLAVFFQDITEQKLAEQFRERLMGIVSHDLRSPLSSISLSAGQLLKREDVSEPVRVGVRRIARSAERMSRMITALLDFTRARLGGGIPLQRRPGELVELVRATLEEFEVTHPGRVMLTQRQGVYTGEWDLDRLAQVVSNLVGNALKHGAAGLPVEVALDEEGAEVILTVRNQGRPIPEELLPHIFDPFRRASDSGREGLGLGLYIVQQIVLAHGGSITASSSAATGTTFTVRLPRGPVPG